MVQGRAILKESIPGVELVWDAWRSTSLEPKVLGEQGTNRPKINLGSG